MAYGKRLKVGGSCYKGYTFSVTGVGEFATSITQTTGRFALTTITVVPDMYGAGDYFTIEHLDEKNNVFPNATKGTLAETLYSMGASAAIALDLPSLEDFAEGHKLRVKYTSVAGVALNVYVYIERIR
jgi:hypothetical protein